MNKPTRTIITLVAVVAGTVAASAIMVRVTPNDSWLAFAGWGVFFVVLQLPIILGAQSSEWGCTTWFSRTKNRG